MDRRARTSGRSATASSTCSTSCRRAVDPRACERGRGAGAPGHRALRRRAGAGLELVGAARPTLRRAARRRRAGRQPARPPRPAPRRPRRPASSAALDSVRPYLGSHGGDVELLGVDEDAGAVHLRLLGSCDGCPSSAVTLQPRSSGPSSRPRRRSCIIDVEDAGRRRCRRRRPIAGGARAASRVVRRLPDRAARSRRRAACREPIRSRVLQPHPAAAPRAAARGRASAARCAPSRSPTSTGTSSTSRAAA